MPSHRERNTILPQLYYGIGFFLTVPVNTQVNFGGERVDILGNPAVRIKGFGIGKIIDQLCKITCHLVRTHRSFPLQSFPSVLIFFNEKSFSQLGGLRLLKYYKFWYPDEQPIADS